MIWRRRRRLIATGLVIVVALILLLVVNAKNYTTMLTDYRVVDPHTIVVGADGAPRGWARVTKVTETSSEVRITVDVLDWLPGPGTAYATRVEMTVGLAQPLDDRVVMDGEGHPVPQPKCIDNACTPPPSP